MEVERHRRRGWLPRSISRRLASTIGFTWRGDLWTTESWEVAHVVVQSLQDKSGETLTALKTEVPKTKTRIVSQRNRAEHAEREAIKTGGVHSSGEGGGCGDFLRRVLS